MAFGKVSLSLIIFFLCFGSGTWSFEKAGEISLVFAGLFVSLFDGPCSAIFELFTVFSCWF